MTKPSPNVRRKQRVAAAAITAVSVLTLGAEEASAGSGGGGVGAPAPPHPHDVTCASDCAGPRKAIAGSEVVVTGNHLAAVSKVLFTSASGPRIRVAPTNVAAHSVGATVPHGAASGPPAVADSYGNSAVAPRQLRIAKRLPPASGFKLTAAKVAPRKAYYDGPQPPRVRYVFAGSNPVDVRVNVVSVRTGATVATVVDPGAEPNAQNSASWNGLTSAGREPRGGSYRFSLVPARGGTPASTGASTFSYHGFKFPVRGPHTYGDGVGAPRSGHRHQGQDVLAACGTPLVAARGGRVQHRGRQAAAGNYVVIDGKGTGHDYVYMHLARPTPLRQGAVVRTGQRIGIVGHTGDATACHLHFEEWSAPGWYEGGHFLASVTKHLQRWDAWS